MNRLVLALSGFIVVATLATTSQALTPEQEEMFRKGGWTDQMIADYKSRLGNYERDFSLDKIGSFCKLVADLDDFDITDAEIINRLGVKSGFFLESYSTRIDGPASQIGKSLGPPFMEWGMKHHVMGRKFTREERRDRASLCEEYLKNDLPELQYMK